ncbi:MAG: NADPH:quinone reductase [Pyrinomonadaceae bacterium]
MKAIQVHEHGEPEVMELREVPDPTVLSGQVLIQSRAIGVNPVDTYIRSGLYPVKPQLPYTPGVDAAGIIEAVGTGVSGLTVGQRVYTAGNLSGAYAEKILCTESQVHPLPDEVTFAQGAAVYVPFATAYRTLFQIAMAQPDEVVLVHGASGGVGIATVQLARAAGLRVIGTGGSDKGRRLVLEQGAHHVLDHTAPDYTDQILKLTEARGVNIIVEMLANINLNKDLSLLAIRGRVVMVGSRGTIEIDPRLAMGREASIHGMWLMNASSGELASIHAALVAGLENKTLRPIVGREFPLAEAAQAHQAVLEPGAYGKIILLP